MVSASDSGAVAGIVLAAGLSTRFGSPKTRATVHGVALVEIVVGVLLDAGIAPVIVVVGPTAPYDLAWTPSDAVSVVRNRNTDDGIGTSVAIGVGACPTNASAAIVALADQPRLSAELVTSLVGAWRTGLGRIVRPSWRGEPRHPVVFDRSLFAALAALGADRGGRAVIDRHIVDLYQLSVLDERLVADIDTIADLARFVDT